MIWRTASESALVVVLLGSLRLRRDHQRVSRRLVRLLPPRREDEQPTSLFEHDPFVEFATKVLPAVLLVEPQASDSPPRSRQSALLSKVDSIAPTSLRGLRTSCPARRPPVTIDPAAGVT